MSTAEQLDIDFDSRIHLKMVVQERRPRLRSECKDGPRPCGFVSCRYNLLIDLDDKRVPGVLEKHEDLEAIDPEEWGPSCALDLADNGQQPTPVVADAMGIGRQRVQQIEVIAMSKLRGERMSKHRYEIVSTGSLPKVVQVLREYRDDPDKAIGPMLRREVTYSDEGIRRKMAAANDVEDADDGEV